jgi:hypothetical protein
VVASHYQVDLEAVSTGYVVDDEVVMNRVDSLAAPAVDILTEDFTDFCSRTLLRQAAPSLKITGRLHP